MTDDQTQAPAENPDAVNQPENINPPEQVQVAVAPAAPVKKVSAENRAKAIEIFCKRTGFREKDVLEYNKRLNSHVFVTTSGGKYELRGDRVRTLSGPKPPKED